MSEAKRPISFLRVIVCLNFISVSVAVTVAHSSTSDNLDQFKYCLRQAPHSSLRECVGRTAISFLQRFDERENYTLLRDFVYTKDDKIDARSLVNFLDTDPVDFRGILENAGAVFSQRNLEWHMDAIYPGLMLKIGPTASTTSVAEFVLDPTVDERNYYEETSTARVLAKQYLLPFLLGLKFNLIALVPLLFAGVCLLLKKSLFLAKLAIYVSSLLGVGGALGALGSFGGLGGLGGGFGGGIGVGLGGFGGPHLHAHAHSLEGGNHDAVVGGYFPGKTSVFNHYSEADEFHHNSPYKRNGRKINSDEQRQQEPRTTVPTTRPSDRFYEYEKQVLMQDRSGKLRTSNGKLGPSAFEDDEEGAGSHNFKPSERLGWKVVDLRA